MNWPMRVAERFLFESWAVWPDMAKPRLFGNIWKALGNYLGINLNLIWSTFYAILQIYIGTNGLKLTNNLAIWSHWSWGTKSTVFPKDLMCISYAIMWLLRLQKLNIKVNPSSPAILWLEYTRNSAQQIWAALFCL